MSTERVEGRSPSRTSRYRHVRLSSDCSSDEDELVFIYDAESETDDAWIQATKSDVITVEE